MNRRLSIRWRLVTTSVVLVLVVLTIVGATVVVLERRSLDADLHAQAAIEARSLLAVAAHAEAPVTPGPSETGTTTQPAVSTDEHGETFTVPGIADVKTAKTTESRDATSKRAARKTTRPTLILDDSTRPYLVRRSASDTLLAVSAPHGIALVNQAAARALIPYLDRPSGDAALKIDGESYAVSVMRDRSGITAAAAVPAEQMETRAAELVRALLIAGGLGALLTVLLAWLAARRALRPLTVMTQRSEIVTAGRLDARVGPISGQDEIARLTQAIDAMLARLESSFATQQQFVQDASHELRTPITIARGHLEVLNPERETPAAVQAEIDLAVDELDRMGRLVERLLLLARAGELPHARLTRVDANSLAAEALERAQGDADRHWVLGQSADRAHVMGDRDALVDVLVNLLHNAERHTGERGMIALRVEQTPGYVRLIVSDDGEGIPTALLPTIFDRFTRADAARTRDAGGAGLGLAICRAYVEAYDGTISVVSTPGNGATFTITLPSVT